MTFFKSLPKVELHAHLNGSISRGSMSKLVDLHRDKWPDEPMPDNCDLIIDGGEYGTNKDPFLIFPIIHAVTDNVDAVRSVTRDVVKEFAEDGVRYLELRTTPRDVPGRMNKLEYCTTVLEEIIRISEDNSGDESVITVKLLLSVDRKHLASLDDIVDLYKSLKRDARYARVLAGLDISGDPRVNDLRTVSDKLIKLKTEGVKVAVHLAEIVNHDETGAVLDIGPDRIGHGTCIHPSLGGSDQLWSQLRSNGCPVEVCLSSNVVCNTVPTYEDHQAHIYHQHGVPIIVCTDDKGVFNCDLSSELRIAAETFCWSNETLYHLQYTALDHAFISEKEREELRDYWKQWRQDNNDFFSG